MIVVDGMPGAGKTTALGRLLGADPARIVVFPEAQPIGPPGESLAGLLDEDADRLALAGQLGGRGLACVSDRCYAGTLAYRYARAATGRADPAEFTAAVADVDRRGLRARHADTTLLVFRLSPEASLARRSDAPEAVRQMWAEWFDPAFLAAYAAFWDQPERWAPPGATVHHVDAPSPLDVRVQLRAATGVDPVHRHYSRPLDCPGRTCGDPRSPLVQLPGADAQLTARSLHYRRGAGGPVTCLRRAVDVAACWTG